jgi:hypothetical protein
MSWVQEWRGESVAAMTTPAAVESSSGNTLAMECQTEAPPSSRSKPSRPMSAKGTYFERLMQSKAAAARRSGAAVAAAGGEMSADDAAALQAARRRAAEAEARAAAAEAELEAEGEVDVVEAFPEFVPQYQQ